MLDNHHRIAAFLQLVQHLNQPLIITRMQTNGRLIQDIEHPNQTGTNLCGQPDALHLATGES